MTVSSSTDVWARSNSTDDGLCFPAITDADILRDGPTGAHRVAQGMDPRATYRSSWRHKDVEMFPRRRTIAPSLRGSGSWAVVV